MSEGNRVRGADEASSKELVSISLKHSLKVNEVFLFFLFFSILLCFLVIFQEIEHLVVGVLLEIILKVHDCFIPRKSTHLLNHIVFLL